MRVWSMLGLALLLPCALAAELPAGEYQGDHGSGTLKIAPSKGKGQAFDLSSYGANGHSCGLDGTIINGQAKLDTGTKGEDCVVTFVRKSDGSIEVDHSDASAQYCRVFCGMRADFTGNYAMAPASCQIAAVKKSRKEFKRLYDQKAYAAALATLQPVVQQCSNYLRDWEDGWIRNDVALAQFKAGQPQACLQTLQPLAQEAAMSNAQLQEQYSPVDADNHISVAKATRTNLKLCRTGHP